MAIIVRYFSTAAAGTGDGTTWANRAALFSSGNWSSVLTGFDFSGSDSLQCRIEGGLTYTCGQAMASGLFSNAPSMANPIMFHGCDSSGNLLEPPDPGWVSAKPPFSTATLPTIATTTNILTVSLSASFWRLIAFTASARTATIMNSAVFDWVTLTITSNSTTTVGFGGTLGLTNSWILVTGDSFAHGILQPNTTGKFENIRIDGSAATSGGTRMGIGTPSSGYEVSSVTVIGCAGGGMFAATGLASRASYYSRCTFINNGTFGIQCNPTASQSAFHIVNNCYFSGNTYGIDANGSRTIAINNRLRDSTSGNFANFGNYPTDHNYVTDSDDATEFADPGSGDYRIKNTADIWGKRYGAGDQPASGGSSGTSARPFVG